MIDQDLAPAEGGGHAARDVSAGVRGAGPRRHGARRHLSAADHRALRRRPSARQPRVPVSLRQRRRGAGRTRCRSASGRRWWSTCISNDPAFQRRFVASPHVDRLNIGPHSDDADRLGPAARGQPVRASVRAPRIPAAGVSDVVQCKVQGSKFTDSAVDQWTASELATLNCQLTTSAEPCVCSSSPPAPPRCIAAAACATTRWRRR